MTAASMVAMALRHDWEISSERYRLFNGSAGKGGVVVAQPVLINAIAKDSNRRAVAEAGMMFMSINILDFYSI